MKWTRCSDRLPNLYQTVWVHVPARTKKQDKFLGALFEIDGGVKQWILLDEQEYLSLSEVTLWAPIEDRK